MSAGTFSASRCSRSAGSLRRKSSPSEGGCGTAFIACVSGRLRRGGLVAPRGLGGQAQVVPGARLVLEAAQQGGRVVGDDERHALIAMHAAAQAADRLVGAQEGLDGEKAPRGEDAPPSPPRLAP